MCWRLWGYQSRRRGGSYVQRARVSGKARRRYGSAGCSGPSSLCCCLAGRVCRRLRLPRVRSRRSSRRNYLLAAAASRPHIFSHRIVCYWPLGRAARYRPGDWQLPGSSS